MDYRRPDCSGLTALALRLAKHLAEGRRNLVFSPLSVYAALALLAEGACGGTLRELLDALDADSRVELAALVRDLAGRALADRSPSGGPAVAFASGVWHDAAWALQPGFRRAAGASYKAEARAVDFANKPQEAATEINRWVAAATNNLIHSILDPASVPENTRLVLASAVYFKGAWDEPFDASRTTEDKFHLLDGRAVTASFMRSGRRQHIAERDGFKVLTLRYKSPPDLQRTALDCFADSQHYFMCVVLPDARDGLPELVDRVASTPGFLRDNLPEKQVLVGEFRLPKFKLSFSGSLVSVLRDDLGIDAVFDADRADLSDMARCNDDSGLPLFVADVHHKAVVEVNEEGTEAAAVTSCYVLPGCPRIPPRTVDFVADHPFMFFVIEEVSGAIVFAGHVLDPSSSQ